MERVRRNALYALAYAYTGLDAKGQREREREEGVGIDTARRIARNGVYNVDCVDARPCRIYAHSISYIHICVRAYICIIRARVQGTIPRYRVLGSARARRSSRIRNIENNAILLLQAREQNAYCDCTLRTNTLNTAKKPHTAVLRVNATRYYRYVRRAAAEGIFGDEIARYGLGAS